MLFPAMQFPKRKETKKSGLSRNITSNENTIPYFSNLKFSIVR